jgi:autotransporter-associated beta strand protein
LIFANSASNTAGYTLASGSAGSLTLNNSSTAAQIIVTGGSSGIAANVTLAGSLTVAPTTGTTLTISGNIGESSPGTGSLLLDDAGTLILSGSNTYTGGTTVARGTLIVTQSAALADGTNLTVGDSSYFTPILQATTAATVTSPSQPSARIVSIAPVPEPGSLALLGIGFLAAAGIAASRRLTIQFGNCRPQSGVR